MEYMVKCSYLTKRTKLKKTFNRFTRNNEGENTLTCAPTSIALVIHHAHHVGFIIQCGDGITFLRITTFLAKEWNRLLPLDCHCFHEIYVHMDWQSARTLLCPPCSVWQASKGCLKFCFKVYALHNSLDTAGTLKVVFFMLSVYKQQI